MASFRRSRGHGQIGDSSVDCSMPIEDVDLDLASVCSMTLNSSMNRGKINSRSTSYVIWTVFTSLVFATCVDGVHSHTAFVADMAIRNPSFRTRPGGYGSLALSATRSHFGRSNRHSKLSLTASPNKIPLTGSIELNHRTILRMASSGTETGTSKPRGRPKAAESVEDDENEWRTILAAFQMYKAAYGDLKVPSRFVVPGMAPWPEAAWKMKLGQKVAAIRSTGKYVQNNETRRKILDDMGFLWRLRAPSPGRKLDGIAFEQVYDALKTYREEVQPKGGVLEIPPNYVVPDCDPWPDSTRGLPLGKILPTVTSRSYFKSNPEAEVMLNKLGFRPDAKSASNDLRYQKVYEALVRYKELYGDLLVPQPFTVPENSEDWPDSLWGLRLGARVNAIRSQGTFVKTDPVRKEELDKLGFVWEPPTNVEGKRRGRKRKSEMSESSYGEDESDSDDENEDTSPAFASAGGATSPLSSFDGRDAFFTGDKPPQWAFEGEDDEESLLNQRKEPIVYEIEKSFNETLEEMAEVAMSVGIMERWTPNKRVVKGKIDKFVPWRNDDFGGDFVFEDVVEALTLYKQLYKTFDDIEENEFVIPEPVEESLRLSPFELAAMNNDSSDDLDDIDGPWDESQDDDGLENKFSVVASSDWPEHLAGMKLGRLVARMRDGDLEVKHLPERKAKLDDIGFDWGDPKRFIDVPFDKFMCALFAYFMIRGDTSVVRDFVMPGEQPWPRVLEGYELGAAVHRLRELQNFLEAYHPVKMRLLRMFDFMFFPELALPLDPDADDVNLDHLYVETMGHPLYHMSTVPLGLPERMLADGPNGPPEKLSSWYNYDYVREFYERPGALTGVADWMRERGFNQLADEHEEKYGQSHFRQLCILKDQLDNEEITQAEWDQEIIRIQQEVMAEFENWREGYQGDQLISDGEYDYNIDEDTYYYSTLDLTAGSAPDTSLYERPMIPAPPRDVIEEPVAEFSLNSDYEDNQ